MDSISKLPTVPLVSLFVLMIVAVYFIAWLYRASYEPMKPFKAYFVCAIPLIGIGFLLKIPIVLNIGIYLAGAVILIFRIQHYFDE